MAWGCLRKGDHGDCLWGRGRGSITCHRYRQLRIVESLMFTGLILGTPCCWVTIFLRIHWRNLMTQGVRTEVDACVAMRF